MSAEPMPTPCRPEPERVDHALLRDRADAEAAKRKTAILIRTRRHSISGSARAESRDYELSHPLNMLRHHCRLSFEPGAQP